MKFIALKINPFLLFLLLANLWSVSQCWSQIVTSDVDQAPDSITVQHIYIVGNEKTQRNIVIREMDITEGVTYPWGQFTTLVNQDQNKIYNLQLFTSVTITPLFVEEDQVELLISVKERWYVIPSIIFSLADRNFSEWWINQGRDFSRVNFGLRLDHNNVGGRNEKLKVAGQLGFTQAFDITYSMPSIDKEQLHGLAARFTYLTNKTIAIRSANNKQVFYTNDDEDRLRKTINSELTYTYRGSFYNFHFLSFGYNRTTIHEDVLRQNPRYFVHGDRKLRYFYAGYSFKHDKRNHIGYPTDGELLTIGLNRYGLFTNDDVNETELSILANKYFPINNKFHFVSGLSASAYLSPSQPYTMVRGVGYSPDFIRGYEVYVIDGQQTIVHKNSFRYELLNLAFDISAYMPLDEFSHLPIRAYLSANFDHGYVNDRNRLPENSLLTNTYLYGYGLGLDLVTFYDLVLRFEYSINSLGTGDFFINVRAPL